jgi:hypothetical protein
MSTQITTAFVQQYKSNVLLLSQQKGSRYRDRVRSEMVTGKTAFFERIGEVSMVQATSRHDDTPQIDTPHSRRKVDLATYRWADLIDNADKVRLLIDPQSQYALVAAFAAGRQMDDVILDAAIGTAYSGETGATTVALPSAQKVAAASAGLTIAKLIDAKEILDEGDVDPDQPRTIAVRPDGITDLLGTTQIQSADYNTVKALVAGQIDTFMGFKFVMSNLVPSGKAIVFTKNALALAVGSEPNVRISERADKNYSTQVFVEMDIGATRVEDEGVVEISYV